MGALNPLFLVAGLAVAVPIFLHLFHRHETRRFSFPALRYLERTEREHARQIRLRQILLLLTRIGVLLLLVGAGARLVLAGRGASHPATAVVIILDNSLSSARVTGERRVLDELRDRALATLDAATDDDRFWLIRAGEPWLPAIPGAAAETRDALNETVPSAAEGDLTAALVRATDLLRTSELEEHEIHLLSDLQRTGFDATAASPVGEVPVVVWSGVPAASGNRALTEVLVGGGLPPLEGQRTSLTVRALSTDGDPASWSVRAVLGGRVRGAGTVADGIEASIGLPPSGSGWVTGYADAEPDALGADDRRYFAYRSRPAPALSSGGAPGVFVEEALGVLERSGRIRRTSTAESDLLLTVDGSGLELRGQRTGAVVMPPDDATLLPALDRRLVDAGIPWRFADRTRTGEALVTGAALPEALSEVRALRWYAIESVGSAAGNPARVLAEVDGEPWLLEGSDATGRPYLLVASPMTAEATTLPVSTGMVRFVDWAASQWAGAGVPVEQPVGTHLAAPPEAQTVRFPSGRELDIDDTGTVRGTGEAGIYTFLRGDTTVAVVALNPSPLESRLDAVAPDELERFVGDEVTTVDGAGGWSRAVFRTRRGPELWWPLLLAACVLLLLESVIATSRRESARASSGMAAPAEA